MHARDFHRIDPFQQGPVEVGPPVLVADTADGSGRMSLKACYFLTCVMCSLILMYGFQSSQYLKIAEYMHLAWHQFPKTHK